jgi:hypothetical protein
MRKVEVKGREPASALAVGLPVFILILSRRGSYAQNFSGID